jgi:hypothetical protein
MNSPSLEDWVRDTFARRDEVMTREEFQSAAETFRRLEREDHEATERRLAALEEWKSNLIGRGIGLAIVGTILVAVCASVITRLIFGA